MPKDEDELPRDPAPGKVAGLAYALASIDPDDPSAAPLIDESGFVGEDPTELSLVLRRFIGSRVSANRYEALHGLNCLGVALLVDIMTVLIAGLIEDSDEIFLALACLGNLAEAGDADAAMLSSRLRALARRSRPFWIAFGDISAPIPNDTRKQN